jgi:integrase
MTVRELLVSRYAPLHQLTPRSVVIYKGTIDHWAKFLGREPLLSDFDDLEVSRFLADRATHRCGGKPISANTVSKDKAQISTLWSWAAKKRLVEQFPSLPRTKIVHRTPKAATVDAMQQLMAAASTGKRKMYGDLPVAWFWSTLIRVAFETGERRGALMALRWSEVDLEGLQVTFLAETRKGRSRDIVRAISQSVADQLKLHRGAPGDLVWRYPGKPHSLYASWDLLRKRAGVEVRGLHSIRKSSASYLAAAGGNASEHLGHSNPRTTAAYLDPSIVRPRETAVSRLPELVSQDAEFVPEEAP